jgi:hypothetical protein
MIDLNKTTIYYYSTYLIIKEWFNGSKTINAGYQYRIINTKY